MARTLADRPSLPRTLRNRRRRQRGIILLMVVSLLALFLLMGVTFAILAIQYKTAAAIQAEKERYGDPANNEMDLILDQVLFGSQQATSLSMHDMLSDLYGNDYVMCPVDSSTLPPGSPPDFYPQFSGGTITYTSEPVGGQQFLRINFNSNETYSPTTPGGYISPVPSYYNGRVLTVYVAQAGQWISTRIAHYIPSSALYVEQLVGPGGVQVIPNANAPFIINGMPFNGTGSGFDATSNTLNAQDTSGSNGPIALLPHVGAYQNINSRFAVGLGGLDESYDAADYQNMFLAFVSNDLSSTAFPLIPSFHRPELLNYWMNNAGSLGGGSPDPNTDAGRALLRQIIFRPMPWDHPNFTGGNPYFTPGAGNSNTDMLRNLRQMDTGGTNTQWNRVWDIDNDGDGVPDSIWIDPGLPVLTAPNGRRYKRLAAILIKDLDGRVNINVSGNMAFVSDTNARAMTMVSPSSSSTPALLFAGIAHNAPPPPPPPAPQLHPYYLMRGLGYGPAEIDFCNLLGGYAAATPSYQGVIQGRYGSDGVPGAPGEEIFSASKTLGMAHNQFINPQASVYSTPPDVWGRGAVAMDYFGRPAWVNMGYGETIDDPYEMQFDPKTAINDTPYTISDMERLLRYYDNDSSMLSTRLLVAAGGNASNYPIGGPLALSVPGVTGIDNRARGSLTTMSSHIPVPRTFWRNDGRFPTGGHPGVSVLDLYYLRLNSGGNLTQKWQSIVPWEFQHGGMFNLNRVFGNGQNDATNDENAIVDDPSEPPNGETIGGSLTLDHLNDAGNPLALNDPRQLYARHLYCLMMLLKPPGWNVTLDVDGDGANGTSRDTARYFAQYAINVVDFRDNDSICTGFEYDVNPFDGWGVDGNLDSTQPDPGGGADRAVVWGVERPELLLTEAIAFHDRRTEDRSTSTETGKGKTTDTGPMMDMSFDQRLRPKGQFYFELYNPWVDRSSGAFEKAPPELYKGTQGVVLSATAADHPRNGGAVRRDPIWRVMVLTGQTNGGRDPDATTPDSFPAADVDRVVYFTDPQALPFRPGETAAKRFYPSDAIAPVMPGRYAVVGSAIMGGGGTYTNYIGRTVAGMDDSNFVAEQANTRRIIIRPNANPNAGGQFEIQSNSATQFDLTTVPPVVGIAINTPRSLTITEPVNGYTAPPGTMWDVALTAPDEPGGMGGYNPPAGEPLDKARTDGGWGDLLLSNKTYPNQRTLCLQRLANPTRQWHADTNPYISIDSTSVDVTAFNGLDAGMDPDNTGSNAQIAFSTFQRGGSLHFPPQAPAPATRLFWRNEPVHTAITPGGSPAETIPNTHVFRKELVGTLGYLNQGYGQPYTNGTMPAPIYVGAPAVGSLPNNAPFPWLVFNNRPFMSPAELLHVPVTSQSQLLYQFSIINGPSPANVYDNTQEQDQVFGHLPNFLRTNNAAGTIGGNDGPLLARLLDYVETPSRFVRTERFYSPNSFSTAAAPGNNPASGYRAPFNYLSRFRDPGRINLNTFAEEAIYSSLVGEYTPVTSPPPALTGWSTIADISRSRQGYGGTPGQINNAFPSIFSNPFRATEAADLMPNAGGNLRKKEAEASLLRPRVGTNDPLLAASLVSAQPFVDPVRSPFYRYLPLQKVANNVTTNSNCYAAWITVGYFEVEDATSPPNAQDPRRYPDGYMLGQELGLDVGNTQRHRAFYLIDRSIPVGFIPGLKLNTDDCVLLRRQIE